MMLRCTQQADQEDAPESTYQAQFDTVDGEWTTVSLPWHEFVPVKRAQVRVARPQNGAPLGNDLGGLHMSVQEPANVWTPGLECRCYQARVESPT